MNIDDIKNSFDDNSYHKGYGYYLLNKVIEFKLNGSIDIDAHIVSSVNGTRVYHQEINVYDSKIIEGKCSCPVGFNCKHVVAVLVFALKNCKSSSLIKFDSPKAKDEVNLYNWLEEFKGLKEEAQIISPKKSIFYRLYLKRNELEVQILSSTKLKKGGYGKENELRSEYIEKEYKYPDYATNEDREIFKLISKTENDFYYYENYKLKDEFGYFIVKKIIATNRCYFKNESTFLTFGEERDLKLNWKKRVDNYNLKVDVGENGHLIFLKPLCYIDDKTFKFGKVVSNYSMDELKLIDKFPQVKEEVAFKFNKDIHKTLPSIPPLLADNQELIEINTKPKYLITLYTKHNPNEKREFHYIKVTYLYENYEVSFYDSKPTKSIIQDKNVISIHRDIELEEEPIKLLSLLDFSEVKIDSDIVFSNLPKPDFATAIERIRNFLEEVIPTLSDDYIIKFDESFQLDFEDIASIDIETETENSWFSMEINVDINGRKVSLLPLVMEFLNQIESLNDLSKNQKLNIPLEKGKYIRVEAKSIKPIIDTIIEIYDGKSKKLLLNPFDVTSLNFDDTLENVNYKGDMSPFEIKKRLENFKKIDKVKPPKSLNASLRHYQKDGLNWLSFLREYGFGGILADDMGLGKTIQTLTLLLKEKEEKRNDKPTLIIAPTSLMGNWKSETKKFTPKLKILIFHGGDRKEEFENLESFDIVVTTYNLIVRDFEELKEKEFYYIILDEAQKIKNPNTKMAKSIKELKSKYKLCLTGTPMENHLGEIWSIFDFLMEGFLWSQKKFNENFRFPIEKRQDEAKEILLKKRIKPFMLRRKKEDVIKELPKKTEIIRRISLEKKQAKLYESVRLTMEKKVRDVIQEKGLAKSHIMILDALLKLRQVCCDPNLLKIKEAKNVKESAKLEATIELIEELIEEGRKIILFSQFTSMLSIIEAVIKAKNITYAKLTGSTIKRDEVIEKFKKEETKVFLISLKAGGVGLNLIEADTVIHYDPWWNPAVEEQATDRAYRIGQDKPIFVYKMIIEGSIEEKILGLQNKKRKLSEAMIDNVKDKFQLTQNDISELFKPIDG